MEHPVKHNKSVGTLEKQLPILSMSVIVSRSQPGWNSLSNSGCKQ